jgi:tetratricopeptide (TPR) repeat protein
VTVDSRAGGQLERYVAESYRQMGAWKVEHNVDLAGNQLDVYAELATPGHLLHRIAVEAKDWRSPVGVEIVNKFGYLINLLRGERLIDEGIIVSARGFSRQARRAAKIYGIRLLEPADLDAMVAQAKVLVAPADTREGPESASAERSDAEAAESPPASPAPYIAHPYPLQDNFTGRFGEREMLSEWFVDDRRPILALTAIGGMGKSALAWVWLQRDLLGQPLPGLAPDPHQAADRCQVPKDKRPEGVLWWSFYEAEASFAAFVDKALTYVSNGSVDPATIPSAYDRVAELVNLLQQRYTLIVLDGFERELRGYVRLTVAYQEDAVAEEMASGQSDYRACTDIHAAHFLRWMAALTLQSRVLLTSRLLPMELDDLAGCRREHLAAMDPDDATTFFHAQGVQGTRAEIQAACEPCGYHPLTLRLLSGMIANDPTQPGDIAAVAGYDLIDDLVTREQHVLAMAYEALRPPLRELLSRLAAFRWPVEYEVAAMLSPFESKRELGLAFKELADRGLIFFDQDRWRYDLHPIIRAYAYDRLADKESIHTRLHDYFAAAPLPSIDQVNSMDDLGPIIELYHHTVCAAQYDEAAELFRDYLADPLYHLFGAYRTEIDLLLPLFDAVPGLEQAEPKGETEGPPGPSPRVASLVPSVAREQSAAMPGAGPSARPPVVETYHLPRLKDPSAQAWTLNALASSYTCSGQPHRAIPLLEMHNTLREKLGDSSGLATGLENLARVQIDLGRLSEAEGNLRHSVDWSKGAGQLGIEAGGRAVLGRLLAYEGAFEEAGQELDRAIRIQAKTGRIVSQVMSQIYRAQLALLTGVPQLALEGARAALQLAEQAPLASQVVYPARSSVWAYWLLGTTLLELKHLVEAEAQLTEALTRCRQINLVELEPDILLSWACWHRESEAREQARECAEEALSIAVRSKYRLKEAEIHNFLAHWEMDEGVGKAQNAVQARQHAEQAKKRAWCDGPPHCYQVALEEAEGLLALIDEAG